ncbi:MAG: LytTR family DNA-binding domain-containing protein, partial [Candidatus Enterosoma sp.]|nr:LytTR family DNA-binding domain-containing protein [Candidatus Enterosoma sp.]
EKVRENNSDITIIFISSKEERVFDTFKVKPFAFVRKSNFLTDITDVIDRFLLTAKENSEDHKLSVISHGVRFTESIKDIVYIEGKGIYQIVHFAQKERKLLEISSRMEALEEQLSPHGFLRIHKGYLVNFSFISAIDNDNTLKLRSGEVLPISRRKTMEVKKQFLALCDKNGVLLF